MKKILLSISLLATVFAVQSQGSLLCQFDFTGGSLTDASANSFTAVPTGSVTADYDRFNNNASSFRCTGSGDYIQTNCPGVSGSGNRTISFWTKLNVGSVGGTIINYGGGTLGGDFNISLSTGGTPGISLDISDETRSFGCTTEDGIWHQFVFVFDSSGGAFLTPGLTVYRDGILLPNNLGGYNVNGHSVNTDSVTQLKIGGGDFNVDDVKMFTAALNSSQVDSLFTAEVPPNPCLVHKYDFTGDANDGVGSSNGVPTGATLTTDRFLNANKAYAFNGSTDYIDVASGVNLNGNFTLGYWAQRPSIDANWHIVLSQGDGNPSTGLHCGLTGTIGGNQNFGCDFSFDGQYDTTNASNLNWQQWYVTFDSATKAMNFYCNGALTFSGATANKYLGSGFLRIGGGAWGGNNFLGKIDDIKLFSCVLSPTQIDSIYQREKINCTLGISSLVPTSALCSGQSNGSITSGVSGAMGSISYLWQPNLETTANLSALASGSYTLTITDEAGCTAQQPTYVSEPGQLYVTQWYLTQPFCPGSCDGWANYYTSGGSGGESWLWMPSGQTGNGSASGLCAGTYTVTVTDVNGCVSSDIFNLIDPPPISANISVVTPISCIGACDGIIEATPSGGTPGGALRQHSGGNSTMGTGLNPYTVTWQPGNISSDTINSLCANTYTVTVMDNYGCTMVDSFALGNPTPISANVSYTGISCFGNSNGIVSAAPTGGTPNYAITWLPMAIQAATVGGLTPGTYTVNIADTNGCTITDSVIIPNQQVLLVSATSIPPTCAGATNGMAMATVTGGEPPYNFIDWNNSMSGDTITGLDSLAELIVTVTDNNNCVASDTISVGDGPPMALTLLASNSACGASTGSVTTSLAGGMGPYNYYWNNGEVTTNISSLSSGFYFLEVYDVNGCYASDFAVVNDANGPSISLNSITNVTCSGANNGAVDVTISGGTLPYDIQWSTGDNTEDISSIPGGSFDLVVTDSAGCVGSFIASVNEPQPIEITGSYLGSGCGFATGRADAVVTGGTSPYSFMWDAAAANQTTSSAFNVASGIYRVAVTDNHGCTDSAYVSVSDTAGPAVYVDSTMDAGCILNGGNGAIYITADGNGPFTYHWNNGATTEDVSGLGIGIFAVSVIDTNGCKGGVSAYIRGLRPGTAQICLASVDTATNHNIIVWNDTVVGVALYEIFRETSVPNQYNLIATIPAGTTNTFEDTIANADNKPWRYKITATDSCGIQSHYSFSHKPIHLVAATNINGSADLSWDAYQGVTYPYYYILRYHFTTGWMLIDSVAAGTSLTYNDPAGLLPADSNYYLIEVRPNVSCGATRSIVNTSRSNIKNQIVPTTLAVNNIANDKTISVFPNPSSGEFNVHLDAAGKYVFKIFDVRGRLVSEENLYSTAKSLSQVKSSGWAHGVYFLQVICPDGKPQNFKLIKQ